VVDRASTRAAAGRKPAAPPLWSHIYEETRRRILTCALLPGSLVSENGLAAEFGSSPTPVRDALGRLRQEGLVTRGEGRGYRVAPLTLADVRELAELRFMIESGIVRLAIQRATPADTQRLRELGRAPEGEAISGPELIQRNRIFHLALARASRNARAEVALTRVLDDSERLFHIGIRALPSDEMAQMHLSLIDAIDHREVETAVTICEHEAFDTSKRVLQQLLHEPWGTEGQLVGAVT